ncbi:MAG: hypothetical protein J6P84_01870 [Alphaproteobacteria bacterium]|nr:hypothetical protein [Alphaproteobacteria bacterium]
MNKFLLAYFVTALLCGNAISAMDYNDTIHLKQKKTNTKLNNYQQNGGVKEISHMQDQSSRNANIPEINKKPITELSINDFKFEHSLPLKDLNWRVCKLIVNGKDFGEHRGTESTVDAENILARRFLDKSQIQVSGMKFASAIRELSWFLNTPPEKKVKFINLDEHDSED